MLKITNFHQHDHWDHNKKYYFFDMGLTSEDHDHRLLLRIASRLSEGKIVPG